MKSNEPDISRKLLIYTILNQYIDLKKHIFCPSFFKKTGKIHFYKHNQLHCLIEITPEMLP